MVGLTEGANEGIMVGITTCCVGAATGTTDGPSPLTLVVGNTTEKAMIPTVMNTAKKSKGAMVFM